MLTNLMKSRQWVTSLQPLNIQGFLLCFILCMIQSAGYSSIRSTINLALHKAVSADTEEEPATAAVDGNPESYWQSGSSVGDHWIEIELGNLYTIDRVVLPLISGLDSMVVEITQGEKWKTVYAGKPENPLIAFQPVETNKIRLKSIYGKQVRIYEVQVFAYDPQPVFVNQSGYDLQKHKRFTAPLAAEGTRFTLSKVGGDKVLFEGKITHKIGDFTGFSPENDPGPYQIAVHGQRESGISVPFLVGANLIEKVSYKPAVDFMVDVRCWYGDARNYQPTDESADCPHLGVAWRDSHQFSFEIPSLLNLYFANPYAFGTERMLVQGLYLGVREGLPENTPEIVRLIYWAVDIYLRGKVNHTLLKEQLAYFLYAYPWLEAYIPEQVYREARDYLFAIWSNESINRWQWHDIEHSGNLLQTYTILGTGKGQFPPGHSIVPNLMMYEVAKREGRSDADIYFNAAYAQTVWLIEHLDWHDPLTTKGQRQGEHLTIPAFVYFLQHYPEKAPKRLKVKIESWAEVAIARSDNMWDYRRYSDERWIIPTIWPKDTLRFDSPSGFNEPGNIAGFPASALSAVSVIEDPNIQDKLHLLSVAQVDHIFGRNPTGRHFCFDGPTDFEGVELGWFQEHQGGAGILQSARGVLDGSPKETTYPYDPHAGDPGHTEGWVTFNTAWNTSLAYIAGSSTTIKVFDSNFSREISKIKRGRSIGIELVAPLNFDYHHPEEAEILIYKDNDIIPVKLKEVSNSSGVFRGIYQIEDGIEVQKLKVAYGFGWHEKVKKISIR